jgi:hypothetical protein
MVRISRNKNTIGSLILVVVIATVFLYLAGEVTSTGVCSPDDVTNALHGCTVPGEEWRDFSLPTNLDETALTVLKIIIIGVVATLAYAAAMKLSGGAMSKRDAFTVILIAILVWWLWDTILVKLFNVSSINELTFSVAKKVGIYKP